MFEKEAEEWADECFADEKYKTGRWYARRNNFQKGAEFGYNKAKVEVEESYRESLCNSELNLASVTEQLEELEKANEWHYMKDVNCYEDLHFPPEKEEKGRVLIWKVQVITEKGIKQPVCYHCGSYGDLWYEINAYHVIAWKEIVLPELPKESE